MPIIEAHPILNPSRARTFEALHEKVRRAYHNHPYVNRLVNQHLSGRITKAVLDEKLIAMLLDENEIQRTNLKFTRHELDQAKKMEVAS